MKAFFGAVLLVMLSISQSSYSASAYSRGEFCFEDRQIFAGSDFDFNEACFQYHFALLYAAGDGTVYEFVLALAPIESGHQDTIELIVNPDIGDHPIIRLDRAEDGTETNVALYGGGHLMDGSEMENVPCYGGPAPLFPTYSCISNSIVIYGLGMGTTNLNFLEGTERTINKLIALKNHSTGDVIDYNSITDGVAGVMFKPLGSATPSEKTHWYDAFIPGGGATEKDDDGVDINLSTCDPRLGALSVSCNQAMGNYVTKQQNTIKNSVGVKTVAMATASSTGLRVAKHNGSNFDRNDVWILGYTDPTPADFGTHADLVSYMTETNHANLRVQRTRCDYIKCVWFEP